MLRKLMIGGAAFSLAAGATMMPKSASAEPVWAWPAVAAGTAVAVAAPYGYYDPYGYSSAGYYPDDAPPYVSVGYYDPGPGYYGGPCHLITQRAPDGSWFRARICP